MVLLLGLLSACEAPVDDLSLIPGADGGTDADVGEDASEPDAATAPDATADLGVFDSGSVPRPDDVVAISAGTDHSCAVLGDGRVKCWGDNRFGQLGLGDTEARGDAPEEMGAALAAVDLGGQRVVRVSAGKQHTCALGEAGDVFCWGLTGLDHGPLGTSLGDAPGEMSAAAAWVPLPGPAAGVTAGPERTCAWLELSSALYCWGNNLHGQLGLGDRTARNAPPAAPIDLGTNESIEQVAVASSVCVRFSSGRIKCWGNNDSGRLGLGDDVPRGDEPGEMGEALPFVDFGPGAAVGLATGFETTLAVLSDGTARWWGGVNDRVGIEAVGDGPGEMGDRLRALRFGPSGARSVAVFEANPCVVLEDGGVKCWGFGSGITGVEETLHGPRTATLAPLDLGGPARAVTVGRRHACALMTDATMKCWGDATSGALGRPRTPEAPWGDALPTVDL